MVKDQKFLRDTLGRLAIIQHDVVERIGAGMVDGVMLSILLFSIRDVQHQAAAEKIVREVIIRVLAETNNDVAKAARFMGVSRKGLLLQMEKLGIPTTP